MGSQGHAFGFEFLRGIDAASELAPYFEARLGLSHHLVRPVLGYMTIGADGTHAGTVAVVNRLFVFLIDSVPHLVARGTELQRVGRLKSGIESAPEYDSGRKTDRQQGQQRILNAGSSKHLPPTFYESPAHVFHGVLPELF